MSLIYRCAADIQPSGKQQKWYLQQYEDDPPFWDSYLHKRCNFIMTQDQCPFKKPQSVYLDKSCHSQSSH